MKFRATIGLRSIHAVLILLAAVVSPAVLGQQPRAVPSTSILNEAKEVREARSLVGLQTLFEVSGDVVFDSPFVGADTIVFKSGARLIFSDKALALRNNLIVAAKTIKMEDQAKPGVIMWSRGVGPSTSPAQSGQAASGPHGRGDGDPGATGAPGTPGNAGIPGRNGPNLTLFVTAMQVAPPFLDLRGQSGGEGGQGQQGGDGGNGHQGHPATATLVECKQGCGYGGRGGDGGPGGKGGTGGRGGAGGTVTLVSLPSSFPALLQLVRADVSGGDGGEGGKGGKGGIKGTGGAQGAKALPWCKDEPGRRGADGGAGTDGEKGDKGVVGIQGDLLYTTLSPEAFANLFGS